MGCDCYGRFMLRVTLEGGKVVLVNDFSDVSPIYASGGTILDDYQQPDRTLFENGQW